MVLFAYTYIYIYIHWNGPWDMVTTSKPTTDGLFFWNVTYPVVIFPSSVDLLIGGVPIPEICGVFVYVLLWFSFFVNMNTPYMKPACFYCLELFYMKTEETS